MVYTPHTSAYVSIRQHASAYVSTFREVARHGVHAAFDLFEEICYIFVVEWYIPAQKRVQNHAAAPDIHLQRQSENMSACVSMHTESRRSSIYPPTETE